MDWLARARELAPLIEAQAPAAEVERRLPDAVFRPLYDAGLFKLLLPAAYGGAQVEPAAFVQVIEEVAKHDASTAWVLCQTAGCSMAAAVMEPDLARAIFCAPYGLLAWGPPAPAKAIEAPTGYRVSGTWNFLSGGRNATWVGGATPIFAPDGTPRLHADGSPVERTMVFPLAAVTMLDVWRVVGLQGTGSDSFTVQDAFVPRERAISRDDPAERRVEAPLYRLRSTNLFSLGFAGVALGIARRLLDDTMALAVSKTPRGFGRGLAHSQTFQALVGEAEARLKAARLLVLAAAEDAGQAAQAGEVPIEQRMAMRLASSHGIREARAVAEAAYHAAGSSAIFLGGAFERRMRDIHAVAQQVQGRDDHFETVGRYLLGLGADTAFL